MGGAQTARDAEEGPSCFDRISTELQDIMVKKGYSSLEDFRGKLKPYVKPGAAKGNRSNSSNSGSGSGNEVKQPLSFLVAGSPQYLVGVILYSILIAVLAIVIARYTGVVGI